MKLKGILIIVLILSAYSPIAQGFQIATCEPTETILPPPKSIYQDCDIPITEESEWIDRLTGSIYKKEAKKIT